MTIQANRIVYALIVVWVALLSGCSSIQGKFTPQEKENIGIFADNTIAMMSESKFGFSLGKAVYLREFIDPAAPEEAAALESMQVIETVLQKMLRYSVKIVEIAEVPSTEKEKVEAYADFLASFDGEIAARYETDPDYKTRTIESIRSQAKLLDALKTAQPWINLTNRAMEDALAELSKNLNRVNEKLESDIDAEYATVIRYQESLEDEKYKVLAGLEELYKTASGDSEAYRRLKSSGVVLNKKLLPAANPSFEQSEAIAEYLVQRLNGLHRIHQEIAPDWKLYRAAHAELDQIMLELRAESRQIRLITLLWTRAHLKMSSGVVNPAEWYDINDTPIDILKLGAGAIL